MGSITLTIDDSTIEDNVSDGGDMRDAEGGGIYAVGAQQLTVRGTAFNDNRVESTTANATGSAIDMDGVRSVEISDCTFDGNASSTTDADSFAQGAVAGWGWGSGTSAMISVSGSTFTNNEISAVRSAQGAALSIGSFVLSITDSTFEDNTVTADLSARWSRHAKCG